MELERKHREGYNRKPVKRGEFSDWESEKRSYPKKRVPVIQRPADRH